MPGDGAIDCLFDFFHFEGLIEKGEGPHFNDLVSVTAVRHSGYYNHRSSRMFFLDIVKNLAATESRHRKVGENGVIGLDVEIGKRLLRTIGYSDVVLDRERSLIRAVQADDVALEHAQATLQRSRQTKKDTLSRLVVFRTTLAQEIANEQSLQTELQGSIDEALVALDAMQTDSPEVAAHRAQLVKMKTDSVLSQIEQAVFAQQNFQQTAQLIAEDPVLAATGRLLWPIPHAAITQGFGPTPYVFEASYAGFPHFHTGIDLAVPLGTPVFAAADGVVVLARPMADSGGQLVGYGNYVIIQHDAGLKTLYGHLLTIGVKEGDVVHRGQLIGLVGSTGNSTGPHTHFEVRIENSPVDPLQMLPDLPPQPAPAIPSVPH